MAGRLGHDGGTDNAREAAVLSDVRNLKASEIALMQHLPALECEWLVGQLRSRPGIAAARCEGDACRLTIEYDADELVSGDVLDFLTHCGVRAAAIHPVASSVGVARNDCE